MAVRAGAAGCASASMASPDIAGPKTLNPPEIPMLWMKSRRCITSLICFLPCALLDGHDGTLIHMLQYQFSIDTVWMEAELSIRKVAPSPAHDRRSMGLSERCRPPSSHGRYDTYVALGSRLDT